MGNLLRVNFVSMLKSKIFWAGIIFSILLIYLNTDVYSLKAKENFINIIAYNYTIPVAIIACVIPFVVGSDFDGGIIRNKIMAGLSKGQIYFANVILSLFCSVVIAVVSFAGWTIVALGKIGPERFGRWVSDSNFTGTLISVFIHLLCVLVAISLISTALTVIGENKAIAIVGILLVIMVGNIVSDATRRYATDTNKEEFVGFTDDYEPIIKPNPYYVPDGTPKKFMYQVVDSMDISAQLYYSPLDYVVADSPEQIRIPVRYDIGVLADGVLVSVLALVIFKHKNIK